MNAKATTYNPATDRYDSPHGKELVKTEAPMELTEVKDHIRIIQEVLAGVMKKDVHYGTIPGTRGGPSLWKAGAEVIFTTFRLGTEPSIEELGDGYRVTVRVFHIPTGQTVGYGMGSCSWGEEKYAWRAAKPGEYDALIEEGLGSEVRLKYNRDGTTKQVKTNPCDLQNTVLKMAVKRARVDACLTVTAASDVFDQDKAPENGNGGDSGSSSEPASEVDEAKMLLSIEVCRNVDELCEIFDRINAIKSAKQKVSLMGAYRIRQNELLAGEGDK